MKYFLTGAGGFIGKAICEYLKGHEIIKFNRYSDNYREALNCEVIINLSAYGNHYNQTDAAEIIKRNILELKNLTSFVSKSNTLQKFYNISTSSVTLPVQTMYSASKLFGETLINSLKDERFVNVRPYSVFGPGEANHRFIPTVIKCLRTGETMQLDIYPEHDWIYVDSFIDLMFNGVIECGSGQCYTNLEVVRALEKISGFKLNYETVPSIRNYDTTDWVCPIRNELKIDLFEGLKLTYGNNQT